MIATMSSGNTRRIPNTAIRMPMVRKIRCQRSSIRLSTVALTTALSKLSEISSTARIATTPASVPPKKIAVMTMPATVASRGRRKSLSTRVRR